ncbi:MAG: pyruvate kinase [Oscillospiraceae bacterium]|nr:pyruvate kinase [Oscillospiraceae bacterium]
MRKTKILATLGPASSDVDTIKQMILKGMDAARINFSHGTNESRRAIIENLKKAREELGKPIALVLDTKGPEIRIKTFDTDKIYLEQGDRFTLTTRDIIGNKDIVAVTYDRLPNDLAVDSRVMIDDGLLELKVSAIEETEIQCVAVNSGFLSNRKGINVPDIYVNLPSLTGQDIEDIKFGIEMGFDYVAASFVRTANDVLNIRRLLENNGGRHMRIIAKIENRDGVDNLDSILELADSIMVARGDLGVEILPEEVPLVQKRMIHAGNLVGKPVVTASHMLESMCKNPRPTRAEANDVANAIFDGSDVVMLSGETANGLYPAESIAIMARIALEAENYILANESGDRRKRRSVDRITTSALSFAACATAEDLQAACIVPITDSGFAARMVAKSRPKCPILAITADEVVCRQLNLVWGCTPFLSENINGTAEVFAIAEEAAIKLGLATTGDPIVTLAGVPVGVAGTTNSLNVRTVGNVLVKGKGNNRGKVHGIARPFKVQENREHAYFEEGDIIICTVTNDEMMSFIKKAGAIVVGSWENVDISHAETVAKALEIPLLAADVKAVDFVRSGVPITVDTDAGLMYNGYR